jgi:hypothetical protein
MIRLLKAATALLCVLGLTSLASAQLTTITATKIYMGGAPIPAGTVTFTPINANEQPIAFAQGGGGLNSPTAFSCAITQGAITGTCAVPDSALTTPANIAYEIQISATATQKAFVLRGVSGITGPTWALDAYGPPSTTTNVQSIQVSYGTGPAPSPCATPSFYVRNLSGGQLYICVGGSPVLVTGKGSSASPNVAANIFVHGDSHPRGYGLLLQAQSYPSLLAAQENWQLTNLAVDGYAFYDEIAEIPWTTRSIGPGSVTLQNMGTNDVNQFSTVQGGAATTLNALNSAYLAASLRGWLVYFGSVSSNFALASNAVQSGPWVAGTAIIAGAPPMSMYTQTANASLTFKVTGTRVDLLALPGDNGNPATYGWTVDGVAENCYPNNTPACTTQVGVGAGTSVGMLDVGTVRGLANTERTVVVTLSSALGVGLMLNGVVGNDTTIPAAQRPLVLASYVSRFGTANATYADHSDALVAAAQAVEATEFAFEKADGFNVVPFNYTAPVADATAWWDPNDPSQTQADWQHPNYLGAQHVAKNIANAMAAAQ